MVLSSGHAPRLGENACIDVRFGLLAELQRVVVVVEQDQLFRERRAVVSDHRVGPTAPAHAE